MKIREIEGTLIDFEKVVYATLDETATPNITVRLYLIGGFEIKFEGKSAEQAWMIFRDSGSRGKIT